MDHESLSLQVPSLLQRLSMDLDQTDTGKDEQPNSLRDRKSDPYESNLLKRLDPQDPLSVNRLNKKGKSPRTWKRLSTTSTTTVPQNLMPSRPSLMQSVNLVWTTNSTNSSVVPSLVTSSSLGTSKKKMTTESGERISGNQLSELVRNTKMSQTWKTLLQRIKTTSITDETMPSGLKETCSSTQPLEEEMRTTEVGVIPTRVLDLSRVDRKRRSGELRKMTFLGSQRRNGLGKRRMVGVGKTDGSSSSMSKIRQKSRNISLSLTSPPAISLVPSGISLSEENSPISTQSTVPSTILGLLGRIKGVSEIVKSSLDTAIRCAKSRTTDSGPLQRTCMEKPSASHGPTNESNGIIITDTSSDCSPQNRLDCTQVLLNSKKLSELELGQGHECYLQTDTTLTTYGTRSSTPAESISSNLEVNVSEENNLTPPIAPLNKEYATGGINLQAVRSKATVSGDMPANVAEEVTRKRIAHKMS
ncbi:hypothetical protein C0992_003378 [Termitomyces sp. T32_za158]|nr:hypothetical protein C0992_003378 [Termitomyces sp. T32_za158]